jgi:Nuclease-related domain
LISSQIRLPFQHPILPILSAKQASVEAGIGGEERVAELLRKYTFPFQNHIFHDLSLTSDCSFQIDHFFLTLYYGVIFETKNIGGSLEFKDNPPQLIRTKDTGQRNSYESPVVQLERNYELLTAWLKARNIHLPLYGAVVLAYPQQIVAVPPEKTKLLFPNMIPSFIKSLPQQAKRLDQETFSWLSTELLNSHHPFIPKPISDSYQIPFSDFLTGVRCEACGKLGMIRLPRTWHCPNCKVNNHMAHIKDLREWFLLCKRTITNRECREFLHVDIDTAKRILQSSNLQSEGTFKKRFYKMDFKIYK